MIQAVMQLSHFGGYRSHNFFPIRGSGHVCNVRHTRLFCIRTEGAGDMRAIDASTTRRLMPRQGLLARA